MRKILLSPRNGALALKAALRQASLIAFGASLAVTSCCSSNVQAQTHANYVTPAAATNYHNAPVSGSSNITSMGLAASDATYAPGKDASRIEPASYGAGSYLDPGMGAACASDECVTAGCDVSWYANYDALWLRRSNDKYFSLSNNSYMPDFNYDFGGRYTVGSLLDCVNGWEAVYAGPFDWRRSSTIPGMGNLQSRLVPDGTLPAPVLDTFDNANQHTQFWRSRLNSFEINRRWWTWDVLSTMIGMRYVDYQEDYVFLSESARGLGTYRNRTRNRMAGAQIGGDLLYPASLRANFGFRGKAGVYANFDDTSALVQNGATTVVNAGDNSVDVAGLIEMGVFANYQVVPSVRLTAGYEFWYMPGIATIPGQNPRLISPNTATQVNNDNELFLHGGSVGAQILF